MVDQLAGRRPSPYLLVVAEEEAKEQLTTATTMYREVGMTYWLEKSEAEYKAL